MTLIAQISDFHEMVRAIMDTQVGRRRLVEAIATVRKTGKRHGFSCELGSFWVTPVRPGAVSIVPKGDS